MGQLSIHCLARARVAERRFSGPLVRQRTKP
jgi:hypothetical protein